MTHAYFVVATLIAAPISYSAFLKLTHRPEVVANYMRAGVPESWLNRLAVLLMVAALGLLVGHWWALAGVLAAGGLAAYFALAVAFHVRAKDSANAGMPLVLLVLSIAALALRLAAH